MGGAGNRHLRGAFQNGGDVLLAEVRPLADDLDAAVAGKPQRLGDEIAGELCLPVPEQPDSDRLHGRLVSQQKCGS